MPHLALNQLNVAVRDVGRQTRFDRVQRFQRMKEYRRSLARGRANVRD